MSLRYLALAATVGAIMGCSSNTGVTFQAGPHADGTGSCCLAHLASGDSKESSSTTMRCIRGDYERGQVGHEDCGCPPACGCHAEAKLAAERIKSWSESPLRKGRAR